MTGQINKTDKVLIIVESPNKVKTISSILKKAGYSNTTVVASVGHIMTLKDGGPAYNSGIYPDKQFKMNLVVADEKKKVVSDIAALAKTVEKIVLATDKDREGELIAWSLIKFCKLPKALCYRVVFHEITPKAVVNAMENPIYFNNALVDAGLSRLMSDKLIGYGLSPFGKKYIGAKSIGRCQSVGLKLISDRETEINNFIPELYFNLYLNFIKDNKQYTAKYVGYKDEIVEKFDRQADVDAVINDCKNTVFCITNIEKLTHKEKPRLPFCTATFQQEAANTLGLRVKDAMSCAQKLFEGISINGEHYGLITYMRTDSTEIADEFIPELAMFVTDTFGKDTYAGPQKSMKKSTDQNGHEALRVVDVRLTPDELAKYVNNTLLLKVYRLIWQRTVASVMKAAVIEETKYSVTNNEHKFTFSIKRLSYPGYKAIYSENDFVTGNEETFVISEKLENAVLDSVKKFTKPKARYTEASLVNELQRREIGRPSTYVTIVDTILSVSRGYAKLEDKQIVPTDRGMQLAEYCNRAFPTLINLNYTKELEERLDLIATGKISMLDYMENFYSNLQEIISSNTETGVATDMPIKQCPVCGEPMVVRRSRFGKLFYGCSKYPKCNGIISI